MKKVIFYFLLLALIGELIALFVINKPKAETKVLSEAIVVTPSPTQAPTETPTPVPTPTHTPKPTPIPTPTPTPQLIFTSQQINEFIERFASQYSVDPNILRHIALCESGFNPLAKKLSYGGLYQFGPITWGNIRKKMGEDSNLELRFNAEEAVQTAAYNLHINNAGIWPNCVP